MKIKIDFSDLEAAVRQMGANPVEYDNGVQRLPRPDIEIELEKGIELPDLNDVTYSNGLLSYKGRQILLYIRNHDGKVQAALANGQDGKKFHVADCQTLQSMRRRGRYERYVVTNKLDGLFFIEGKNWKTGLIEEGNAKLRVCQHCLKKLNYKGATHRSAFNIARDFEIGEFFSTYSSFFSHLPRRHAEDGTGEGYSANWKDISNQRKVDANYTCDKCAVDLSSHKHLLHVHHINGVKSDNRFSNLRVLCASCHREEPLHGNMFIEHKNTKIINHLRKEQNLLKQGNWDKAVKYCDPALRGVLDACKHAKCPVPEIGLDIQSDEGVIVANLEIAWLKAQVGVAIANEDRLAAERVGWKVLDSVTLLEDIERVCQILQQGK